MREIKYRAWDKENQRFMDKDSFVVDPDGTVAEVWNLSELHGDISDEVELMQYTGLKDVNGVEIFEGDVVKAIPVYSDLKPFVGILTIGTQRITISGQTYDHELYDYKVLGHKYQYPELMGEG